MSAGIYAMRSQLKTILLEKYAPGGQMIVIDFVENYPGFAHGASGPEIAAQMEEQARNLGLETASAEVVSVDLAGEDKVVRTSDAEYHAATVIIASGATPRRLGVSGEDRLIGKGVSYCATCDGAFFRDKEIAVVGGGDRAIQEACFLTRFAAKLTIIHRRDALRAAKILQKRAFKNPKIEFAWNSKVAEIAGGQKVESITLQDVRNGKRRTLPVDGIFVLIGTDPDTNLVKGKVVTDPDGYVITNEDMETNVPGVFAAGDCRRKSLRQMLTAAADGAIAAVSAERYIESLKDRTL